MVKPFICTEAGKKRLFQDERVSLLQGSCFLSGNKAFLSLQKGFKQRWSENTQNESLVNEEEEEGWRGGDGQSGGLRSAVSSLISHREAKTERLIR